MKMTVSRLFEAGAVLQALSRAKVEGMEAFVTFVSDFSENVIRGLRGQLTFKDNHLYQEKILTLESGVSQTFALSNPQNLPARMIWIAKTTPFTAFITGFQWQMTLSGECEVVANFSPAPASGKVEVMLAIFF